MTIRTVLTAGIASTLLSLSAHATTGTNWAFEAISKSTGYTVNGQQAESNQFGLVKHSNTCSNDELYISWASDSANVWALAGQKISLAADFDGVPMDIPLEVVSIKPMAGNMHQVIFGHSFANPELLALMSHASSVNVLMPSVELAKYFKQTGDSFSLAGFTQARLQALTRCNSQSS
ncbi:MAG: hypothetical protein P1U47_12235 [Zhongshania sp.]|uniref:hypothetical protein n=1 Tax=Zhongshania sp. TaxID=1971902 RepID=UPI002634F912|nr:hypothetical protein [Zhongshania sp.]MDF1693139.1 hypothetical protein [Zhongshania sp.]